MAAPIPPKPKAAGLSFDERERLVRLFMELRQPPFGVIGMLETRNLLARLFEDFAEVRDEDVDTLIKQYAEDMSGNYTNPDQLQLT